MSEIKNYILLHNSRLYKGGLKLNKRILIGVIITECHIDFQQEILRGIISQSFKSQCDLAVISPFHNFFSQTSHKQTEKRIFNLILSQRFDGFLYDRSTFYSDEIKEYIDGLLKRSGKPVMLLDSGEHKSFETTSIDDCSAFETITDHLIEVHGLKKIYCITGPKKLFVSEERLKGFKNSMKKHGLYYDKSYCYYGDFWIQPAKELAEKIACGEIERPEGIVCGNDNSAIALSKELIRNGIRVPEDIAVTGYDASPEGYEYSPSITSYSRPNFQLGAEAFRRLYRIITGRICNKVPNENGVLRVGKSCGCHENVQLIKNIQRRSKINSSLEKNFYYGDMLFDITNVSNYADFADRFDHYTYFIYKMSHLNICLTRKYIESSSLSPADKLTFNAGDDLKIVLSKSSVKREPTPEYYFSSDDILPVYSKKRNYPCAYYISPLHYNENFFGYSAVSFGKDPLSFTALYLQLINYVNIALEQVRIKSFISRVISSTNKVLLYDEATGLLNRNGIENEIKNHINSGEKYFECIRIQLTGISKTYYQSGEDKCRKILFSFSNCLKSCLNDNEICFSWSDDTIGIITFNPDRTEKIYSLLCEKIKSSQINGEHNCNIDFTLGNCIFSSENNLSEIMHKSAVNRIYSYNISKSGDNPQFEKLCILRNKIMKNPENSWNISEIAEELYLSKSYLQKIYKSYFGKSIIEETIQFRIEKAKCLLSDTNMTITEISRECGYSSYNYFVRQFKTFENISPSEYRSSIKE